MLKPTSGKVQYDGIDIKTLGEAYKDIFGYLSKNLGFYSEFTVTDYLQYMASMKGLLKRNQFENIWSPYIFSVAAGIGTVLFFILAVCSYSRHEVA